MFEPIQNKRIYQHVVEQIQLQIFNGELKKGDKLPSERDLTDQFNVSRASVREAIRALEVTGLIDTRQGEGNFISGSIEKSLLEPLTAMFHLNEGTPRDLLELRSVIEVRACELAAKRINDAQATELRKIIDDMSSAHLEAHKAELDKKLHYYITEITGNVMMISLLSIIAAMMESFIQTNRQKILENPNNSAMLMESHEDIVEAIISKDSVKAGKAMKSHMKMVELIVYPE